MKNIKGITLIALVITIIILLILGGVAISMITGGEGLLTKTKDTKNKYTHASVYEALQVEAQNHQYDLYAKNTDKSLIEYLEEKGIVKQSTKNLNEYIVNVEKLSGKKINLGNGTDEQTDVYKLIARKSVAKVAAVSITQLAIGNGGITGWDVWYFGTAEEEAINLGILYNEQHEEDNEGYFNYVINDKNEVEIIGLNLNKFKLSNLDVCSTDGKIVTSYHEYSILNLEKLIIPSEIEGIIVTKVSFNNNIGEITLGSRIKGIKEIVYPNTVVEIGGNKSIPLVDVVKVTLPQNLKVIGDSAFRGWSSLTSVEIPTMVESIGNNAFDSRGKLGDVYIPETVESIGDDAFGSPNGFGNYDTKCKLYVYGKDNAEDFNKLGTSWTGKNDVIYLGKQN